MPQDKAPSLDDQLNKSGHEALSRVPFVIRRGLGDLNTIEFRQRKPSEAEGGEKRDVASYVPGKRVIYIDNPDKFLKSPDQTVWHEATHLLQNRLHPSVTSKFPPVDPNNRYGRMTVKNPNDPNWLRGPNSPVETLRAIRAKGGTVASLSDEEQGALAQQFSLVDQRLRQPNLAPEQKQLLSNARNMYQTYFDDYAKLPQATNEQTDSTPTSWSDKVSNLISGPAVKNQINTKPAAPQVPVNIPGGPTLHEDQPLAMPERTTMPDQNTPPQAPEVPPMLQNTMQPQTDPLNPSAQVLSNMQGQPAANIQPQATPQTQEIPHEQLQQQIDTAQKRIPYDKWNPAHKAVHFLSGMMGDDNANLSPTQKLFKGIIGGAMIGMANGAAHDPNPSFLRGVGNGVGGVMERRDQQAKDAQQRQQQELQNEMAKKKEQREENADTRAGESHMTDQQMKGIQIRNANMETLRSNMLLQGQSYKMHQDIADADQARVSGMLPVEGLTDIAEGDDFTKAYAAHPEYDWRASGVKTIMQGDGPPEYRETYSAYNPGKMVKLTPKTLKQWETDGLFDVNPEFREYVKGKSEIPWESFNALDKDSQKSFNQNIAKNKESLGIQELLANVNHLKKETWEADLRAKGLQRDDSEKDTLGKAFDYLNKNNGDTANMPSDQRIVLAKYSNVLVKDKLDAIKQATIASQNGDQAAAQELPGLWADYHQSLQLSKLGGTTSSGANPQASGGVSTQDFKKDLTPTAQMAFDSIAKNAPNIEAARLALAKIQPTDLPDADRQGLEPQMEAYYATKKQADDATAAERQKVDAATKARVKSAKDKNRGIQAPTLDSNGFPIHRQGQS